MGATMNLIMPTRLYRSQPPARMNPRLVFVLLAVVLHAGALAVWQHRQHRQNMPQAQQEMTISFALQSVATPVRAAQPVVQQKVLEQPVEKVSAAPAAEQAVASVEQPAAAPAIVASTEPDYKAAYLNNPPPSYPLAARRMGMQGRVVLQVEVLAAGVSGQVSIQHTSGFPVLDNAALQAVKSWRFQPATQAGRAVDKWFMIPVQFSLKEQSA